MGIQGSPVNSPPPKHILKMRQRLHFNSFAEHEIISITTVVMVKVAAIEAADAVDAATMMITDHDAGICSHHHFKGAAAIILS